MKKLLFISLALIVSLFSFSQSYTLSDQQCWGTSGIDGFDNVLKTTSGGTLLLGSVVNTGGTHLSPSYGATDAWVIKLDENQNVEWEYAYGGTEEDFLNHIVEVSPNKFILLGYSNSGISGNKTAINFGSIDIWIVCIDNQGNSLWQTSYGGNLYDGLNGGALFKKDNNNFVIVGEGDSGVSGNKTTMNHGDKDIYLIEIDSNGNILADYSFGGNQAETAPFGKVLSNGNSLLSCSSRSGISGNKPSNNFGNTDSWNLEVDNAGNIVNELNFGGLNADTPGRTIERNGQHFLAISSDSDVSGNKTSPLIGLKDLCIVKCDQNLNIVEDKTFGTAGCRTSATSMLTFQDGFVFYGGVTGSTTGPYKTNSVLGVSDCYMLGVDTNLNYQWNYSFGGNAADGFAKSGLNTTATNGFDGYFFSTSNGFSGQLAAAGFGNDDLRYTRINSDLNTNELKTKTEIYPNPTSGTVYFSSPCEDNRSYTLFSETGVIITIGNLESMLDFSKLKSGIYFLQINSASETSYSKIIKQ